MKELLIFLAGAAVGLYFSNAEAQTYAVQNSQGYVQGYIQQNGNTVNVLTPNGNTVGQPLTIYPTQLTTPAGGAIGSSLQVRGRINGHAVIMRVDCGEHCQIQQSEAFVWGIS